MIDDNKQQQTDSRLRYRGVLSKRMARGQGY